MEALPVRVVRDVFTDNWRVVCDLHGELARYRKFWTAAYDAKQHRENCELYGDGEGPPDDITGRGAFPRAALGERETPHSPSV